MNKILYFSYLNIKRNFRRSCITFVAFSCYFIAFLSTILFVVFSNRTIENEWNRRNSGNIIYVKDALNDINELINIEGVEEAVCLKESYVLGEISIEDIGVYDINVSIIYTKEGEIPQTFLKEYEKIFNGSAFLVGRQIENDNEIIINSGFFKTNQFRDYSQLLGKKVQIYYQYLNKKIAVLDNAVIVGIIDENIKSIGYFDNKPGDICFAELPDNLEEKDVVLFCNYYKLNNSEKLLIERYGENQIITTIKSSLLIQELSRLTRFMTKIFELIVIILGIVFLIYQLTILIGYLNGKKDFLIAINAVGYRKIDIFLTIIVEYQVLITISIIISFGVSIIITNFIIQFINNFTSATIKTNFSFQLISLFIIVYSFLSIVNFLNIGLSTLLMNFSKTNE